MLTCDHCSNLLLDSLYGLLEDDSARALREHLAACSACRDALARAEAQQNLFARAAQVYAEVPLFTAPSAQALSAAPETIPPEGENRQAADRETHVAAAPAASAAPAPCLPFSPSPELPPARPARLRRWLAAAAGLLLAAAGGLGYFYYQDGLSQHQTDLAAARRRVEAVEAQLVRVEKTYARDRAALPGKLAAGFLQVEVLGPASYQRDSASRYAIHARGPDGRDARADVEVRLVDDGASPRQTLFQAKAALQGRGVVTVPGGLAARPGSLPRLEVAASTGSGREVVEQLLTTSEPAHATHLALSKAAYRVGEVLFFRSLTVERFSLKPAAREFRVAFALRDGKGQTVRRLNSLARHGIAGGELALTGDLPGGEYTLRVESAADLPGGFLSEERRFTLLHDDSPQLNFDRYTYGPSDTVNAAFRARLQAGAPVPLQPITVEAEFNGQPLTLPGAPPGMPLQMRTDELGRADIRLPLPPAIPENAAKLLMKVQVHDGTQNEKLMESVAVVARGRGGPPTVALFPEGGDLVAGVPNRVYFLARDPLGHPVALEGTITDRQGREAARFRSTGDRTDPAHALGAGTFVLTPSAGEVYTLRGRTPGGAEVQIPLPGARGDAVAVTVPDGVGQEGEPLRVTVRDPRGRSLLVLAECRGRVVDQTRVTAGGEGAEVVLTPVAGTRGVVRVTVCEAAQGRLVPLAERLVYRAPTQRLTLTATTAAGKEQTVARPGEHVAWDLRVRDEKGAPAAAWLLAAVVDQKWARPPGKQAERSPPVHFYLTRELRQPEDLEEVEFLLADTPAARQALDLFLGTHGWRRLVPAGQAEQLAGGRLSEAQVRAQARSGQPAVLLASSRTEDMLGKYRAALAQQGESLRQAAERQRADLEGDLERRLAEARGAAVALAAFERLPWEYLWQGLAVAVMALLTVGGLLLAVGVARVLRGNGPARGAFGIAFVALTLCVGGYFLTLHARESVPEGPAPLAWLAPRERKPLDPPRGGVLERGQVGEERLAGSTQTGGLYALGEEPRRRETQSTATTQGTAGPLRELGQKTGDAKAVAALRSFGAAQVGRAKDQRWRGKQDDAMSQRFHGLLTPPGPQPGAGTSGQGHAPTFVPPVPASPAPPTLPMGKGGFGGKMKSGGPIQPDGAFPGNLLVLRQYAHQQPRGGVHFQETVFWHPALEAPNGAARVEFDLSSGVTTYRVLLYGHSPTGRLGAYQGQLEARP